MLAFGGSSLEWLGGLAVLRATGDAHAIGAAHGRLLAPLLPAVVAAVRPSIEAHDHRRRPARRLDPRHAARVALALRRRRPRRERSPHGRGHDARRRGERRRRVVRRSAARSGGARRRRARARRAASSPGLAHSLTVIAQQAQAPARVWIGRTFALAGLDDGGDAAVPVVEIAHPDGPDRVGLGRLARPARRRHRRSTRRASR